MVWMAFGIGVLIGVAAGIFILGLCQMGGKEVTNGKT